MPALTPSFVFEFERRMRAITENEYARMVQNLWWQRITRVMKSDGKAERVAWLLSTAMIEETGLGGNITFDDIVAQTVEYVSKRSGKGLKVQRDQIEDLDGTGLDILAKWSGDMGAYMAYWPQKRMSQLILNGAATDGSAAGYDGNPFFSDNTNPHPLNPYAPAVGSFANWLHGAASGSYPGGLAIDDSVTVDVALTNLGKAIAFVKGIKMPNGQDPRFLQAVGILAPPRMTPRVAQLTKARFIAQAAASGGGAGDIEAILSTWGMAEPIEVDEFAASTSYSFTAPNGARKTVTGSDTTWYLVLREMTSTMLGGLVYVDRKPFKITYYTGDSGGTGLDAILDRQNELEYHCQGRNVAQYGHPYALLRIDNA